MNGNKDKEFCGDCGIEFDKHEMSRRKGKAELDWVKTNPYWICFHCASRY